MTWQTVKSPINLNDTVGLYTTALTEGPLLGTVIDIHFLTKTNEFKYQVTFANAWRDWFFESELVPIVIETQQKPGF